MTEPDYEYVGDLADKLKELSDGLDENPQKLLAGILTIAHGLTDGTNGNGSVRATIDQAFDPLPADKVRKILEYQTNPNIIVKHEELVAQNGKAGEPDKQASDPDQGDT
jgi:hypothetical protein